MRWIARILLGLVAVVALLIGGLFLFGPTVNTPAGGLLAAVFPFLETPVATRESTRSLEVADGYSLSLLANIPGARVIRVTTAGDLLVSSPSTNQIYFVDHVDGSVDILLANLDGPHGLEIHDGYLYVGEDGRISRIAFDGKRVAGELATFAGNLPTGGGHWKKTIRLGPDGDLYLAIGSTCNVCIEEDQRRAALWRYDLATGGESLYATGLRNAAGFAWDGTGRLFATDNGRDLLGDDLPPCELNEVVEGGFYGWPFAYGDRIADPDLGAGREDVIAASIGPVFEFRAHNAPLGIEFLRSSAHPADYRSAALVALHGSWNRSQKDGYKVVSLHRQGDGFESRDFLSGFLVDDDVSGRPAELAEAADGTIYVADDYANAIYKIVPSGSGSSELTITATQDSTAPSVMLTGDLWDAGDCAACHGDGEGQVALVELDEKYDLDALTAYLQRPTSPMPPVTDADTARELARALLSAAP